jgi:YggT family protein
MAQVVVQFFDLLFTLLYIAILVRVILSWVQIDPYHPVVVLLDQITEPFLAPIRRIVPPMGMMDITPIVAIIVIQVLQRIVHVALNVP